MQRQTLTPHLTETVSVQTLPLAFSNGATRMTADNTQEAGSTFRGMEHMFLLTFTGEPTTTNDKKTNSDIFALGALTNTEIVANSNHKKIYSLTFPIGTDNMLFYGTATREAKENYQVGKITSTLWPSGTDLPSNVTKKPSDISFSLQSIITDNAFDKDGDATRIVNYLSTIAKAKGDLGTASTGDDITWASTVGLAQTDGAYRALATLYNALTTKNGEARSGSTESVKRMVLDLYKSAAAINYQSSVAGVKSVAKAICKAIESTTDGITFTVQLSETNTTPVTIAAIETELAQTDPNNQPLIHGAEGWTATIAGINEKFPANLGLPMGAAQLRFDASSRQFAFNTEDADPSATPTPLPGLIVGKDFTVNLSQIDYPAELIYFDNSPIRVTDQYKTAMDFPATSALWDDNESGFPAAWAKGAVASTTRAVALKNNVNYGVALLESTVKLASDATSMTDNMKTILGGTATDQTDIDPTKFNITGILIGGQPATVNWNLVKEESSSVPFSNVIYDRDVANYGLDLTATPAKTLTPSASEKNWTVVFDNYSGDGTQDDVMIALEIVNGDKDFYGAHNLIPAGSTFYLVGKLQRSSGFLAADPTAAWQAKHEQINTDYRITFEDVCRVFCQDYKTIANITLSKECLKSAYSTIPDLVSTETVFGLSVDLEWEPGLVFNVNM